MCRGIIIASFLLFLFGMAKTLSINLDDYFENGDKLELYGKVAKDALSFNIDLMSEYEYANAPGDKICSLRISCRFYHENENGGSCLISRPKLEGSNMSDEELLDTLKEMDSKDLFDTVYHFLVVMDRDDLRRGEKFEMEIMDNSIVVNKLSNYSIPNNEYRVKSIEIEADDDDISLKVKHLQKRKRKNKGNGKEEF